MIEVNSHIRIPEEEIQWSFARSGGPGGQNVNKVSSKAVLRWNVNASAGLPADVKARLYDLYRGQITTEGDLVIMSQRWREQSRNREDCLDKLRDMVRHATIKPRPRKATRATRGSRERRLAAKRHQSARKEQRRPSGDE
jgi:ribosome-associated protein